MVGLRLTHQGSKDRILATKNWVRRTCQNLLKVKHTNVRCVVRNKQKQQTSYHETGQSKQLFRNQKRLAWNRPPSYLKNNFARFTLTRKFHQVIIYLIRVCGILPLGGAKAFGPKDRFGAEIYDFRMHKMRKYNLFQVLLLGNVKREGCNTLLCRQ